MAERGICSVCGMPVALRENREDGQAILICYDHDDPQGMLCSGSGLEPKITAEQSLDPDPGLDDLREFLEGPP